MADGIDFNVDSSGVDARLHAIRTRLGNLRQMYRVIGSAMIASVRRNFEEGGRPDAWQPSKRALREHGKTLIDTARLYNSFFYDAEPDRVTIGTNVPYAPIHHFGKAERHIPRRPFLMFQEEDVDEIEDIVADHMRHLFGPP